MPTLMNFCRKFMEIQQLPPPSICLLLASNCVRPSAAALRDGAAAPAVSQSVRPSVIAGPEGERGAVVRDRGLGARPLVLPLRRAAHRILAVENAKL